MCCAWIFRKWFRKWKKLILQGPRPWNSTPSNLGRFALQFGEVWKVDFSLVFLSDLSHCISLGLLYQILVCWASFFHLTRAKIELPRPNKTIAEGFLCVLTHFRTSHSCQQAGRWWRGGVWSLYLAIAVHFTSCWIFQMYFRTWGATQKFLRGGRRCKIHIRSCVFTTLAFPQIYIHFRWWTHDSDGRPLCKVLCVIKRRRGIVINDVSGRYHSSCYRPAG